MNNDIIKHVRTKMTSQEKEKATSELLKGLNTKEWNFAKIYREIGALVDKPYQKGVHQQHKRSMFEMLVAKFENEGND